MSEPRWPVVVFDLDGTVVDTIALIIASYRHAMWSVLGVRPTPEETRGWIGKPLYDTFAERYPDRVAELVASYLAWSIEHLPELLQRYPGMAELLAELNRAGVATGVVTSKRRASAARTLEAADLGDRIGIVVAMEDTALHKPNPEPLLLGLQLLDARPEQAVYVGDAVVDIQAARAAGMAAIAVTWGAGERAALLAAGPLVLVETVEQLRAELLP